MAIETPPAITPGPVPVIQRGDRETFSGRLDAFVRWIIAGVPQFVAVAANVWHNALEAFNSATASTAAATAAAISATEASAAASIAAISANSTPWVSGTNYGAGVNVWSLINSQLYKRIATGAGATDPYLDPTNWRAQQRQSAFTPVNLSGTAAVNLALGDYFYSTIAQSSTVSVANAPPGGSSFTLRILMSAGGSIAFPSNMVIANYRFVTTLQVARKHMFFFATEDGGANWLVTVAPNFG